MVLFFEPTLNTFLALNVIELRVAQRIPFWGPKFQRIRQYLLTAGELSQWNSSVVCENLKWYLRLVIWEDEGAVSSVVTAHCRLRDRARMRFRLKAPFVLLSCSKVRFGFQRAPPRQLGWWTVFGVWQPYWGDLMPIETLLILVCSDKRLHSEFISN